MAKPISTAPITMGKHGRMHEAEAERAKGVTFGEPHPAKAEQERQKNREMRATLDRVAAQKPVAKPVEKARPDIAHRMDALRSALSDKYPHNDLQVVPEGLKVAVPTGHITIESEKVAACANNAELRAYIDALPIL